LDFTLYFSKIESFNVLKKIFDWNEMLT